MKNLKRDNNSKKLQSQQNNTATSETFIKLVESLGVINDGIIRGSIVQQIQRLSSEEKGKIVVRCLPYMDTSSYDDVARKIKVSHTQIRKWVRLYAPDIVMEKIKGGDKS